jgi:hypothetical protein
MICCGYSGMAMGYDPFNFAPGDSGDQVVWGADGCDGYDYDITDYYSTWWTGNTQFRRQ